MAFWGVGLEVLGLEFGVWAALYVHDIEDGVRLTKYAGEHMKELHNLIPENSKLVQRHKDFIAKYLITKI